MTYIKQKNTIYRNLGTDIVDLLKTTNAILAGGSLTSIFSGKEINDYDIYFRNKEDLITFVRNAYCDEDNIDEDKFVDVGGYTLICTSQTARSITFNANQGDLKIQLIHFGYFENPSDIFESYDFCINMGAFDFSTEEFVLHENFLTDIAQRRLTFNAGTKYPIMSTLRVPKYIDRGYTISKKEMFKIGLAIVQLEITSWEELEDQLSGFYGVDVRKMFDHKEEFSLDKAIEMLDLVEELPDSTRLSNPNLRQVLFYIEGNPYKEQSLFFIPVNRIDESTGKSFTLHQTDEWELGIGKDMENLTVYPTHEEAVDRLNQYWRNGTHGVMAIVLEAGYMDMGPSGLELFGSVKPFGYTIQR